MGIVEHDMKIFQRYGKKCKTVGYFEGFTPVILTKDVNFIKAVMMKDFSNFVNKRVTITFVFQLKLLIIYKNTFLICYSTSSIDLKIALIFLNKIVI